MSILAQNNILKSFKFVFGMGLIMFGFTSEVSAAFFKCARCNLQSNKCASDLSFFKSCEKNCPKTENDPIEKCRTARCTKNKDIVVGQGVPISDSEMNGMFGSCPAEVIGEMKTLVKTYCDKKQKMIDEAAAKNLPLREETKNHMLRNCPKLQDRPTTPLPSQPSESKVKQETKTASDFSDVSKFCPLQLTAEEVQTIMLGDPSSQSDPKNIMIKGNLKLRAAYPITQERRDRMSEQAKADGTDWPLKSRAYLGGTQDAYTCSYEDDKSNLIKVTAIHNH